MTNKQDTNLGIDIQRLLYTYSAYGIMQAAFAVLENLAEFQPVNPMAKEMILENLFQNICDTAPRNEIIRMMRENLMSMLPYEDKILLERIIRKNSKQMS